MPGPSSGVDEIVGHLKGLRSPANIAGMARYGIVTDTALGISNAELRKLARTIGRNHARALALWATDIREAQLLASYTAEPKKLTLDEARRWAADLNSWEMVDALADLFVEAGHHAVLIAEFAEDEREFVRRTAFSMIAWGAVHLKKEPDETILAWLPLVARHAGDGRNFVRKAVNWALRQIGKRNAACHGPALALARRLAGSTDRVERACGRDAVKELESEKVRQKLGL